MSRLHESRKLVSPALRAPTWASRSRSPRRDIRFRLSRQPASEFQVGGAGAWQTARRPAWLSREVCTQSAAWTPKLPPSSPLLVLTSSTAQRITTSHPRLATAIINAGGSSHFPNSRPPIRNKIRRAWDGGKGKRNRKGISRTWGLRRGRRNTTQRKVVPYSSKYRSPTVYKSTLTKLRLGYP